MAQGRACESAIPSLRNCGGHRTVQNVRAFAQKAEKIYIIQWANLYKMSINIFSIHKKLPPRSGV